MNLSTNLKRFLGPIEAFVGDPKYDLGLGPFRLVINYGNALLNFLNDLISQPSKISYSKYSPK